jgi:hypothetical protein
MARVRASSPFARAVTQPSPPWRRTRTSTR